MGVVFMLTNLRKFTSIEWSFILVFIIAVIFTMTSIVSALEPVNKSEYKEVTLQYGDTLWQLADQYKEDHSYTYQQFISWVEEVNGIHHQNLTPGETIVLPIEKK
ncbi:cell division suppressor protein YneA [Bacillus taeanensis]|uniref:Cell division suppressor protein YneA n=2 Tax=Bacillus taeanensis TaxID=273032 RepID=A0A366XXR3_9BACI|nr:cell division suppressor protein YneA [Bacillus taeanensis]